MADDGKEIKEIAEKLIEKVREFSILQKHIWQRIPYLALLADGRNGYSDRYSRAYSFGFWALDSSVRDGYYNVYVDLETGELVAANDPRKLAVEKYILAVAMNIDELNAQRIVKHLLSRIEEPTCLSYDPNTQAEWRNRIRENLGLEPEIYKRKNDKDVNLRRLQTVESIS